MRRYDDDVAMRSCDAATEMAGASELNGHAGMTQLEGRQSATIYCIAFNYTAAFYCITTHQLLSHPATLHCIPFHPRQPENIIPSSREHLHVPKLVMCLGESLRGYGLSARNLACGRLKVSLGVELVNLAQLALQPFDHVVGHLQVVVLIVVDGLRHMVDLLENRPHGRIDTLPVLAY